MRNFIYLGSNCLQIRFNYRTQFEMFPTRLGANLNSIIKKETILSIYNSDEPIQKKLYRMSSANSFHNLIPLESFQMNLYARKRDRKNIE